MNQISARRNTAAKLPNVTANVRSGASPARPTPLGLTVGLDIAPDAANYKHPLACFVSTLPRAAPSAFTALLTLTGSPKSSMTDPARRVAFKKPITFGEVRSLQWTVLADPDCDLGEVR